MPKIEGRQYLSCWIKLGYSLAKKVPLPQILLVQKSNQFIIYVYKIQYWKKPSGCSRCSRKYLAVIFCVVAMLLATAV